MGLITKGRWIPLWPKESARGNVYFVGTQGERGFTLFYKPEAGAGDAPWELLVETDALEA